MIISGGLPLYRAAIGVVVIVIGFITGGSFMYIPLIVGISLIASGLIQWQMQRT